jgi:hypothetical protein
MYVFGIGSARSDPLAVRRLTCHRHQILLYQCRARGKVSAWCAEDGTVGPYRLRKPDSRSRTVTRCAVLLPPWTVAAYQEKFASSKQPVISSFSSR